MPGLTIKRPCKISPLISLLFAAVCLRAFAQAPNSTLPYGEPNNVIELRAEYGLNSQSERMLRKNGFVVIDSEGRSDLNDCYDQRESGHPYVTTGVMLEIWSELVTNVQKAEETKSTAPKLTAAIEALDTAAHLSEIPVKTSDGRKALNDAVLELDIADALNGGPAKNDPNVARVVREIVDHQGDGSAPIDDYSQYTPRGYYTDSTVLKTYFLESLWFSRQFKSVSSQGGTDRSLRSAVAMAAIIRSCSAGREELKSINAARQSTIGLPNAVSTENLIEALNNALGNNWNLDDGISPANILLLRKELARDVYPKTSVHTMTSSSDNPFPGQIVSLLPDYSTPDGSFTQLVINPSIVGRSLPTGMDIGCLLGFSSARSEINANYDHKTAKSVVAAATQYKAVVSDTQGFYGDWLRSLADLTDVDAKAPSYMHGDAWGYESLNTALAGWAQLRHAYLLTAAQPYAETAGIEILPPIGEVEPNPQFFHDLGRLAAEEQAYAVSCGALDDYSNRVLKYFVDECSLLEMAADAELKGTLSDDQARSLNYFGKWIAEMRLKSSPVVADVATGMQGEVLDVGTGEFYPIIVMPTTNGPAYVGWTTSYYEHVCPPGQRLTDAQWKAMQSNLDARPDRPQWTLNFIYSDRSSAWQARAGLRAAEKLFVAERPEAAIASLRRIVAANPNDPLATEAQFRIGRYFADHKQTAKAIAELQSCSYLPGCDAFDEADYLIYQLKNPDFYGDAQGPVFGANSEQSQPKHQPTVDTLGIARRRANILIDELKAVTTANANRLALTSKLIHIIFGLAASPSPSNEGVVESAITVFPRGPLRDAVIFDAAELLYQGSASSTAGQKCYDLSNQVDSVLIRYALVALAVAEGFDGDDTEKQAALLAPFVAKSPFDDEAISPYFYGDKVLLANLTGPYLVFDNEVDALRKGLVRKCYDEGRFADAVHYEQVLLASNFSDFSYAENFPRLANAQPSDYTALLEYNEIDKGLADAATAAKYYQLALDHPDFYLRSSVLDDSESLYRQLGNSEKADVVLAAIKQRELDPGLVAVREAQADLTDSNIDAALALLPTIKSHNFRDVYTKLKIYDGVGELQYELEDESKLRLSIKPLIADDHWKTLSNRMLTSVSAPQLAEELTVLEPEKGPEIYKALLTGEVKSEPDFLPTGDNSSDLNLRLGLLKSYPNAVETQSAFNGSEHKWLQGETSPDLQWLVNLVDRGPRYKYSSEVDSILSGSIEDLPEYTQQQLIIAEKLWPNTRAEALLLTAGAENLYAARRPETALSVIKVPICSLGASDPIVSRRRIILGKVKTAIVYKHNGQRSKRP